MNATGIVAVVLGTSLVVAAASYAVFRAIGVELRRRHLEVGTAVFLQAGVIYAVFLAFVFGQALTSYVAADNAIDMECAALHGAAILGRSLPAPQRLEMAQAMEAYIAAVLSTEWRSMELTRDSSPEARSRQQAMLDRASGLDLQAPKDIGNQSRIIGLLIEAHREREERIFQARQGIPGGLWAMILVYCAILVGLVFFSSLEYAWSHATMSGIFGGLNALVLLAVFLLQYPFEGPFRLSPKSFELAQQRVQSTFGN